MKAAYIVDAGQLVDDRRVRATVVSWVLGAYPTLAGAEVSAEGVEAHLTDAFTPDEALALRLWRDLLGVPSAAIEPSLLQRLVAERRYGRRLYEAVFGVEACVWRGAGALASVERRAWTAPVDGHVVVVSPRGRVEVMTALLGTGWSPALGTVVTGDDVSSSDDVAVALLAEAVRRVRRVSGEGVAVQVCSAVPALLRARGVLELAIA